MSIAQMKKEAEPFGNWAGYKYYIIIIIIDDDNDNNDNNNNNIILSEIPLSTRNQHQGRLVSFHMGTVLHVPPLLVQLLLKHRKNGASTWQVFPVVSPSQPPVAVTPPALFQWTICIFFKKKQVSTRISL